MYARDSLTPFIFKFIRFPNKSGFFFLGRFYLGVIVSNYDILDDAINTHLYAHILLHYACWALPISGYDDLAHSSLEAFLIF